MLLRSSSTPILSSLVKGSVCHEDRGRAIVYENESPMCSRPYRQVSFSSSVTSPLPQLNSKDFDSISFDGGDWDFEGEVVPKPSFRRARSETDLQSIGSTVSALSSAAGSLTTSPLRDAGFTDGDRWCTTGSRQWSRRVSLRRQSSLSVISSVSNSGSEFEAFAAALPEGAESVVSEDLENVASDGSVYWLGGQRGEDDRRAEYLYRVQDYSVPSLNHRDNLSLPKGTGLGVTSGGLKTEFGRASTTAQSKAGSTEPKDAQQSKVSDQKDSWMSGYNEVKSGEGYTTLSKNSGGTMVSESPSSQLLTQSSSPGSMFTVGSLVAGGGGSGRGPTPRVGTGGGSGGQSDSSGTDTFYKRALDADPGHPLLLRNYAKYLQEVKKDTEKAESYYERAILANPGDGELLGLYAKLIWDVYQDEERAGNYFDQALQAAPDDCYVIAAYASFLWGSEGDEDSQAEVSQSAGPGAGQVPSMAPMYNNSITA